MDVSADEVFAELCDFARRLGYSVEDSRIVARNVMDEYGPRFVAAAKPGSEELDALFMAIRATRRPGGGSA